MTLSIIPCLLASGRTRSTEVNRRLQILEFVPGKVPPFALEASSREIEGMHGPAATESHHCVCHMLLKKIFLWFIYAGGPRTPGGLQCH